MWQWCSGDGAKFCESCKKAGFNKSCEDCDGRCPDLMPENIEAWNVLQAGCTQLRVGGMGGTIGFDYVALKILADAMFVDTTQAFWKKVQAVENVIRRNEHKQIERSRHQRKRK